MPPLVGEQGVDGVASDLEQLPGISRTIERPPEPAEIEVETMADVLEGHYRLEADPVEVWEYTAP